jgi:isoaspartyl peptidase/L-asparaginase-like protein (Ntn-hydrolase superfamily)
MIKAPQKVSVGSAARLYKAEEGIKKKEENLNTKKVTKRWLAIRTKMARKNTIDLSHNALQKRKIAYEEYKRAEKAANLLKKAETPVDCN